MAFSQRGYFFIMQFFARFFENLQQDLKAFLYWCLVFTVFRIAFIWIYSGQLNGNYADVPMALFLGFRLSLKTAGIVCLIGFVLASLPNIIFSKWPAICIRNIWHGMALVFFSICFMARIPYYKIFNAAFNMMLINGVHDDVKAILVTAIEEYQLLWRLPVAVVIGIVLAAIFVKLQKSTPVLKYVQCKHKYIVAVASIIFTAVFWVFVRYGGALNYANSINWESAARLKSNLLNEAILDDGQALYRVRESMKKLAKINNINIPEQELRKRIALAGGNPNAKTIDEAFLRTVNKPKLSKQPQNVVLIVGESFGQWPFLPKFKNLGLVNNMLKLQNSEYGASISTMLAHGSGTISAVNGLLTGLPDTGLYENYQPLSMKEKYATGIGYIMQQLGYKTVFWYGGFPGWQNLKNFVMAQSFDEFHCADEFGNVDGNAWGCSDEVLLQKVEEYMDKEQVGEKVFHMVLTTSNHPPYTLDIDRMGFPRAEVRAKLTTDIRKDEETLTELGHIWYADKTMGEFVQKTEKKHPDSLYIITGDHSERFNFAIEQDVKTTSAIPCFFYGQGVNRGWFDEKSFGCHIQIAGTLAEVLGETGFKYSAAMPNLFTKNDFVFNHRLIADEKNIYIQNKFHNKPMNKKINAARNVVAWRVQRGNNL
ncbi:MAG: LTA synthase family protein [Erysipelotrichaceae bacterium]